MTISESATTRGLVFASAMFGGALLGTVVQRLVVDTPAWQVLGVQAWADYSRHADLGAGIIVYPIEAIGWTILALAAGVSHRLDRRASRSSGLPIYLTAVLMIGVLATTLKAAPIMLSVGDLGDDNGGLHRAFDLFTFWGLQVRGTFIALGFLTSLWALAATFADRRQVMSASPAGSKSLTSGDGGDDHDQGHRVPRGRRNDGRASCAS